MKKILFISALAITLVACTGCFNMQIVDTTWSYERGIISLPNGEIIEGKITSWRDYENSDQIQVSIDGNTYLVHSSNVAMISE